MPRKFFIKNLALFLIPMIIPLLIIGSLSFLITQRYVNNEITRNSSNLFLQIDRSIQLIFYQLDSLFLSFSNPSVIYSLKDVLRTQSITYEQNQMMNSLKMSINTPANSQPYIESIYVYIENQNGYFLTSSLEGLVNLKDYYDKDWFESYMRNKNNKGIFAESRLITRSSFEKPIPITTIYKPLISTTRSQPDGVIALNIYTQYIENQLKNIDTLPDQSLLIADELNTIIFKNYDLPYLQDLDLTKFNDHSGTALALKLKGEAYSAFRLLSPNNGWNYISITPDKSLFAIPSQLRKLTFWSLGLCFLLGFILAYYITTKNVRHIRTIFSIIKSAENNTPQSELALTAKKDEYGYIINNIVQSFILQNQLNLQLTEKKYLLKSAELLALQYQMNPHFLFNTLETIYWKTLRLTGQPNEVNFMLENLSKVLHYALDRPQEIVTIEKEINYTKSYIDIQQIRYPNKFKVNWEFNDEDVKAFSIIKMSLQPLIENSIYHGIKEKEGMGCIKIKVLRCHPSCMRITVTDNGVGMNKEHLERISEHFRQNTEIHDHIGLFNTNKRMTLTYGEAYGIQIRSKPGFGTVIDLNIPI
ncbi:sensor histidine kinase [Paenibacillus radicis (ex Xue et al. 2023)]|uniref:Histidine kinase n=1 Tax=Paenibacillus radicis (ex Xue et al. 2023) TaxID=2972489 RepID=A0ABT1YB88_9BACL|nr:sensor histidine kinase [Paenibacillus radicis (ex Xue et al. 2023)]MCR8630453.1 histidine kinase [Paenibacillus radicis (ex Xue et al. 2023)]